jgi:exopolysaccharide biosynthesis polyprenyl glycosylphosphotransferase
MLRALKYLTPLFLASDVALAVLALAAAQAMRQRLGLGMGLTPWHRWVTPEVYASAAAAFLAAFFVVGSHRAKRVMAPDAWRGLALGCAVAMLFFVAALFFLKIYDFSRLLVAYFAALSTAAILGRHLLTRRVLRRAFQPFARRVLLVGGGDVGQEAARRLKEAPFGTTLAGVVATDGGLEGLERLGSVKQISELVKRHDIDQVMIALPAEQHALAEEVVLRLQADPVRVFFVPDVLDLAMIRATVEDFWGIPVVGLREPPLDGPGRLVKRVFDLLVGGVLTVLFLPVMAVCAFFVWKHDRGPILFRQKRVGENGAVFDMLKFRSMVVDAEKRLKEVGVDLANLPRDNPVFKVENDPRVTPVGRFLRRWSLDELPQFFNVLKGEMSLVGPRAEEAAVVAQYSWFYRKRLAVKPGITGPMQVGGRADLPLKQRLHLELAYIESWSLWSDVKILAKTIPVVIWGKGAY